MTYRPLPESVGLLEEEVLDRWDAEDTFHRSLAIREGAEEFVFYEGPPTANGRPGVHHILSRTIKDVVARYRAMSGRHVTRIAGWDTHGLPVELEVERRLRLSGKPDIERMGIAEFNRECRKSLFTYKEDWEKLSRRIGYWLDYKHPYITCSPEYIESVWWALSEIDRRGLLYKGYKIIPYCPRCGTGLSSHEVAQGYRVVKEPSVYVKFRLVDDPDGAAILSWTTTPWTLPGNVALAVGEDIEYARVRIAAPDDGSDSDAPFPRGAAPGEVLIVAADLVDQVLRHPYKRIGTVTGRELTGLRYSPLFEGAVHADSEGPAWTVLSADFVTTEDGTGVVHTAVMYGQDDFDLGAAAGLPMQHTVDTQGRFVDVVPGGLAGRFVKDPETDTAIIEDLAGRDLLYRRQMYEHSYPHCWRCQSALLYMARDSWYVQTTAVKNDLLSGNESVAWHPPEIGSGRMGEWLENNVDWAISRDRYWGTPLPIWVCEKDADHTEVIGSFARLAERAGGLAEAFDPHRPEIDEIVLACECGGEMRRVPEVLDAWFDSGSMPYAQWHYPFENKAAFESHFPADFIAEGVDQTRGWFYSLLALSTLLFDRSAYRAVVVNDLVLDENGQKMSKSRGNVVDPWEAIDEHGVDAIRFYLLSSSNPWLPKRWDPAALRETNRKLFDTLRSTYRFFSMYADLEGWSREGSGPIDKAALLPIDRWLLSRLDTLTGEVRDDLEAYNLTRAARCLSEFVLDDLSNWYVRQTRDRFWATRPGDAEDLRTGDAFAVLHEALQRCALLLAPFAPFLSDWIFNELTGASVHIADFPWPSGWTDATLEREMDDVRRLSALGRAAREEAGIRVRQPLRELKAVLPDGRRVSGLLLEILRQELNVKQVVFPGEDDALVHVSAKADFGQLGPVFGKRTPEVAKAIGALEPEAVRALRRGESVAVELESGPEQVEPEHVRILEEARGELTVQAEDGFMAAVDGRLDDELISEGIARELVNRVQRLRRDSGLNISDRIMLTVAGARSIEEAALKHSKYIESETLALRLEAGVVGSETDATWDQTVDVDGVEATIGIRLAVGGDR